jgi:glycerate 2-kinase
MVIPPEKFLTDSLRHSSMGADICQVLAEAINHADPAAAIKHNLIRKANQLLFGDQILDLDLFERVFVLGAGKAVVPMVSALSHILKTNITSGVIITKDGYLYPSMIPAESHLTVFEAGHPLPDQRNLRASSAIASLAENLKKDDLVICLISGGASSLLIKPSSDLSLQDIKSLTILLLSCGASIDELNTIRKHLDEFKGGGLARALFPATVVSLILSDVIGDHLDMVASGPTVADPTTYADAWAILEKYQIIDQVPEKIKVHIKNGILVKIPETVKLGDPILDKIRNILIGNNTQTVKAACQAAEKLGYTSKILTTSLQGEASEAGQTLSKIALSSLTDNDFNDHPTCLIAGGETTVTIKGSGKGGRNQELALGSVIGLSASEHELVLVSLATDGGDGPTDAAGAVATNHTFSRGELLGLHPQDYMQRNDSYHYFNKLGDLIKTGPTLTNVNDLALIFIA